MTLDQLDAAESHSYEWPAYRVQGFGGIAFHYAGRERQDEIDPDSGENVTEWTGQQIETGRALLVMVGDDRRHPVDPDDVEPLDPDDYCHECGQIGCTHDGRDRDE